MNVLIELLNRKTKNTNAQKILLFHSPKEIHYTFEESATKHMKPGTHFVTNCGLSIAFTCDV